VDRDAQALELRARLGALTAIERAVAAAARPPNMVWNWARALMPLPPRPA
jgi:hypothetical protein